MCVGKEGESGFIEDDDEVEKNAVGMGKDQERITARPLK